MKTIPNHEALKVIESCINQGQTIRIRVRGNSMSPLLIDNKDEVTLVPCVKKLEAGDIILFRYNDGFILHRIVEIKADGKIIVRGDANEHSEIIETKDVIALANVPKRSYFILILRRVMLKINCIVNNYKL